MPSTIRGREIPDAGRQGYDFDRLERAVQALIRRCGDLREENVELRRVMAEREGRLQSMEDRLLELNQMRQDAVKRIDDLIAQIDQLDARLAAGD